MAIGIAVAGGVAIGLGIWLAYTGKCSCCLNYLKALLCATKNQDDKEEKKETVGVTAHESIPNKTTHNLASITQNARNDDSIMQDEVSMNRIKGNFMASRSYLDPASLEIRVYNDEIDANKNLENPDSSNV